VISINEPVEFVVEKSEVGDSEVKMYYTIPMPPNNLPEETVGVTPLAHHG